MRRDGVRMNMFSKLFGESDAQRTRRRIKEIEHDVRRSTEPLGNIGIAVVKAAQACVVGLKPMIDRADENSRAVKEVFVWHECVYLFVHLTFRSAHSHLNEKQIKRLEEYFLPLVASTTVDAYCAHWGEDRKAGLISEFYSNLNNAEIDYAASKELIATDNKDFTGDSLLSKFGRNVAEAAGSPMNPAVILAAIGLAAKAYAEMNLPVLMSKAGDVL